MLLIKVINLIFSSLLLVLCGCANTSADQDREQVESQKNVSDEAEHSAEDLQSFMEKIEWETGQVSMEEPYDFTFEVESTKYQLWKNDNDRNITLVPAEVNPNRWVTLNKTDSEKLLSLLEVDNK